jgi:hypothetical protein
MTFWDETLLAARGCLAILRGERDAPEYFDLTGRGLAGALIAFLVVIGIEAHIPVDLATPESDVAVVAISPFVEVLTVLMFSAVTAMAIYLYLRIVQRADRFVPLAVVIVWGQALGTLVLIAVSITGFAFLLLAFVLAVVSIYFFIRAAMMVGGLSPMQVVGLIGVQLVSGLFSLTMLGAMLPPG